jgi:hypothetical protein
VTFLILPSDVINIYCVKICQTSARLGQSVEHETLNLGVVGSSPTLGDYFLICTIGLTHSHLLEPLFHVMTVQREHTILYLNHI